MILTAGELKEFLRIVPDDALVVVTEEGLDDGHVGVLNVGYGYAGLSDNISGARVRALVLRLPQWTIHK
jgi:hypothetical protein